MRPAINMGVVSLGICGLITIGYPFSGVATAGPFPASVVRQCVGVADAPSARAPLARTGQVTHDGLAGATFFFSRAADGAARMTVKANDLEVDKTVYQDGRFQIQLQAGDDRVSVAVGTLAVDVARGNRGIHVDVGQATDADWLQVKVLLAGSRALRLFRSLAYSLDTATVRKPAGASLQASDAILGYLDGDVAAVGRFGEQTRAARIARIRRVSRSEDEGPNPCYEKYEAAVIYAANDYDACRKTFSWYNPWQAACVTVWTLQVESAWFQFLACSAIPLKLE